MTRPHIVLIVADYLGWGEPGCYGGGALRGAPTPRIDQLAREGFLFYIKSELRAVKWRHWKLHFYWEPEVNEGKGKLESPYLFNVTRDPKEETDVLVFNTWVMGPVLRMVQAVNQSCQASPNTPPGKQD